MIDFLGICWDVVSEWLVKQPLAYGSWLRLSEQGGTVYVVVTEPDHFNQTVLLSVSGLPNHVEVFDGNSLGRRVCLDYDDPDLFDKLIGVVNTKLVEMDNERLQ